VDGLAGHVLRPDRDRAVRRAAEDVAAPRDLLDVAVLGYYPVAFVAETAGATRHVNPVNGLGLAQFSEFCDRQTLEVQFCIEGIEALGQIRARHERAPYCNVF